MDADERSLREQELKQSQRASRITALIAVASFVVSAAAVVTSVVYSSRELHNSQAQFKQSAAESTAQFAANSRQADYNTIIDGLSSSAAAVQDNSMWLLREYVENRSNYPSHADQITGVRDALQTLSVFIQDNSDSSKRHGLVYYENPQPVILSRAMDQIKALDGNSDLGSHDVDVSRGNLHGISLPYFAPKGSFSAIAADFRLASLTNLDLTADKDNLTDSFLTCADLTDANFGQANLTGTDLTGANLSGADLSHVAKQHGANSSTLTAAQLEGATISKTTRLPEGIDISPRKGWGTGSDQCKTMVDAMTGMNGGQGYVSRQPCPATLASAESLRLNPPFTGSPQDLVDACRLRHGSS
jgi:hypothetical protein